MICDQTADPFEGDLQSRKQIIIGRIFRICRYLIADPPQPCNHIGHAETDGDNFVLLQQTFPAAASALHEMCGSNSVHIWCYIK